MTRAEQAILIEQFNERKISGVYVRQRDSERAERDNRHEGPNALQLLYAVRVLVLELLAWHAWKWKWNECTVAGEWHGAVECVGVDVGHTLQRLTSGAACNPRLSPLRPPSSARSTRLPM